MKEGWSNRWKKLLVWVCGYLSIVAFALVGGYIIVKSDDESLRKTVHKAFIVTIIFTAISAFLVIYSACFNLSNASYSSGAYEAYSWLSMFNTIAKIVTFAVFAIIDFFVKDKNNKIEIIDNQSQDNDNNQEK